VTKHPLEEKFNATAKDILDAIEKGFRSQVDVKGKLAELFLHRRLERLREAGKIDSLVWNDKDDKPDFEVGLGGRTVRIECKNVRSNEEGRFRKGEKAGWFKVEIQKTRGGTDRATGKQTRSYRTDQFDVLAACLFNQTHAWDYLFSAVSDLETRPESRDLLAVFQAVPPTAKGNWFPEPIAAIERVGRRRR